LKRKEKETSSRTRDMCPQLGKSETAS